MNIWKWLFRRYTPQLLDAYSSVRVTVVGPTGIKFKEIKILPPGISIRLSKYGNYYAKVPEITACVDEGAKDRCSLLRTILINDLQCDKIQEVEGEGGIWWDFWYKDCKFTWDLLIAKCGGSELYPTSCTISTPDERDLLDEVAVKIVTFARLRQNQDDEG